MPNRHGSAGRALAEDFVAGQVEGCQNGSLEHLVAHHRTDADLGGSRGALAHAFGHQRGERVTARASRRAAEDDEPGIQDRDEGEGALGDPCGQLRTLLRCRATSASTWSQNDMPSTSRKPTSPVPPDMPRRSRPPRTTAAPTPSSSHSRTKSSRPIAAPVRSSAMAARFTSFSRITGTPRRLPYRSNQARPPAGNIVRRHQLTVPGIHQAGRADDDRIQHAARGGLPDRALHAGSRDRAARPCRGSPVRPNRPPAR